MSRGARCILIIASALLAVITLAATGCGNAARSPSPASSPSAASASPRVAPTPGLLMHVRLPTHMRALTRRFGSPDRIVLPVNIDTSPVGQWFKWHVRKRGVVFAALGDDYDRTPAYDAPVRYLHVQADVGATSRTLFGFVLNRTTRREVLSALGDQVVPSDGRWLYHHRDALKYRRGDLYTALFFSRQGRLIGVSQAPATWTRPVAEASNKRIKLARSKLYVQSRSVGARSLCAVR